MKFEKSMNLCDYIKSELDTLNYKNNEEYTNNKKRAKKCLQDIGKSLKQNTNFHDMLNSMSDEAFRELYEDIKDVSFHRKRFTEWVNCNRDEANKTENELRSKGYFTYGEYGGEYGYFKHRRKLTDIENEWIDKYTECCYYNGQPCARWKNENGNSGEDCECVLGREYTTLVLLVLDIEEEKNLGVWKQDIIWTLNGYGGEYSDCYYSLQNLKVDAISICDDPTICNEIKLYDGKKSLNKGNINIKVISNDESSE